mgnify:CR=1 FL=1
MKMILLQDVKSVGKKGELVNVSEGYAKNFLLPKKLGVEATKSNLNDYDLKQKADAKRKQEELEKAQQYAQDSKKQADDENRKNLENMSLHNS